MTSTQNPSTTPMVASNKTGNCINGMLARARDFNNAGVALILQSTSSSSRANNDDRGAVAWTLFKGALEVYLASQRELREGESDKQQVMHDESPYIARAQACYRELLLVNGSRLAADDSSLVKELPQDDEEGDSHHCSSQSLQLFAKPLRICGEGEEEDSCEEDGKDEDIGLSEKRNAALTGAIIVLNLALLKHAQDSASTAALSMYRLAYSLLHCGNGDHRFFACTTTAATASLVLRSALLNNAAVWYWENGDRLAAQASLRRAMIELPRFSSMSDSVSSRRRLLLLEHNVRFMSAHEGTSPAA